MIDIKNQWKEYINLIHYNIILKDKYNNAYKIYKKRKNKLGQIKKDLNNIEKSKKYYLGIIKNYKNPNKSLKLNLDFLQIKKLKSLEKILRWIGLFKFDGYILYINKANDMKIYKVKDLKNVYNLKSKKESYNLHEKIGTFKGKPLFLVKYPYAISLNVLENGQLYYDAESYYNYINMATKANMTKFSDSFDFINFIKTNLILIIIILALIFLFTTTDGKQILNSIIQGFKK